MRVRNYDTARRDAVVAEAINYALTHWGALQGDKDERAEKRAILQRELDLFGAWDSADGVPLVPPAERL